MKAKTHGFVICVRNAGYPAALEVRKIYKIVPDADAESHNLTRVIDESGEDYVYPAHCFVRIELPQAAKRALVAA
jgi:hypothetical protein